MLKFLPRVPRSAKRLANHLRLLLAIASQRNMLGGDPMLEAAHLGKWAVLLQRWPELGFAICENPALLADLEKKARAQPSPRALAEFVRDSSLEVADIPSAAAFFKSAPPAAPSHSDSSTVCQLMPQPMNKRLPGTGQVAHTMCVPRGSSTAPDPAKLREQNSTVGAQAAVTRQAAAQARSRRGQIFPRYLFLRCALLATYLRLMHMHTPTPVHTL